MHSASHASLLLATALVGFYLGRRSAPPRDDAFEGRRLQAGDYEDVVKTLLLMLGDTMVLVRTAAAACFKVLALGLREVLPVIFFCPLSARQS